MGVKSEVYKGSKFTFYVDNYSDKASGLAVE